MEKVHHAAILFQDMVEKSDRLLLHRGFQFGRELRVFFAIDVKKIEKLHPQPLAHKVFRKPFGTWIGQKAFGLFRERVRIPHSSGSDGVKQLGIREDCSRETSKAALPARSR